jgi:RimJ/RimL family protein N-acetyltransferase
MPDPIHTARLILRNVTPGDAAPITTAVQDPGVYRNVARLAPGQTLEMTLAWLVSNNPDADDLNHVFAITREGTFIGLFGAHRLAARRPFEIGYWLARAAWGQGVMTEAAQAVVDWLDRRGEPALTSGYFRDNPASGRVLQKLGFLPAGRGEVMCLGRGEKVQHVLMARLNPR